MHIYYNQTYTHVRTNISSHHRAQPCSMWSKKHISTPKNSQNEREFCDKRGGMIWVYTQRRRRTNERIKWVCANESELFLSQIFPHPFSLRSPVTYHDDVWKFYQEKMFVCSLLYFFWRKTETQNFQHKMFCAHGRVTMSNWCWTHNGERE